MFDFLFDSEKIKSIATFCNVSEESSAAKKYNFCCACLNVVSYGMEKGALPEFVYYEDIAAFFEINKADISEYFETWYGVELLDIMKKEITVFDVVSCNDIAKQFYVYTYVSNALYAYVDDFENAVETFEFENGL